MYIEHFVLPLAFSDEYDDESDSRPMSVVLEADLLHENWLQELPEDLDVCIAQRDFEGAVDLIDRGGLLLHAAMATRIIRIF